MFIWIFAYSFEIPFYGWLPKTLYWHVSVFISYALLLYMMICRCVAALNLRLVTELHGSCERFHTSGRKINNVWTWSATGQTFASTFTSWSHLEPSGNGDYCDLWSSLTGWTTWDDEANLKTCSICEHEIQLPSYCN